MEDQWFHLRIESYHLPLVAGVAGGASLLAAFSSPLSMQKGEV
jgi:hypothetical protein